MKNKFLLPSTFKWLGLALAIPGIALGIATTLWDYEISGLVWSSQHGAKIENLTNELAVFATLLGLLFTGFAKQSVEDELLARMRLNSLQWGVLTYMLFYMISLVINADIVGALHIDDYRSELNLILPLLFFNGRFYYLLLKKATEFEPGEVKLLASKPYLFLGRLLSFIGFTFLLYVVLSDQLFSIDDLYLKLGFFAFVLGMFWWSFSKRPQEDEGTYQIRLEALQLSFYIHYIIILIGTASIYSLSYLLFLGLVQCTLLFIHVLLLELLFWKAKWGIVEEDHWVKSKMEN